MSFIADVFLGIFLNFQKNLFACFPWLLPTGVEASPNVAWFRKNILVHFVLTLMQEEKLAKVNEQILIILQGMKSRTAADNDSFEDKIF